MSGPGPPPLATSESGVAEVQLQGNRDVVRSVHRAGQRDLPVESGELGAVEAQLHLQASAGDPPAATTRAGLPSGHDDRCRGDIDRRRM